MAAISPTVPLIAGVAFTPRAAAANDTIANPRGTAVLYVENGGAGSINVTLTAQSTGRPSEGSKWPAMTLADAVVAVAAGAKKLIGPIPTAFNNESGAVEISYSGVTLVTVAVVHE